MAEKTFINRLQLTDFRNYAAASLRLDGRHVVLTGRNGSGKTNLMEAVSFLSPGRGLRRAVLSDVARAGAENGFSIFASVEGMAGEADLGTGSEIQEETAVRRLRINGSPVRSVDELTDHLRVLWLTPAMDGLFTGASSERRRFLDRLVLSIDPQHGRRASDFERAMRSRNKLLSDGRFDASWLSGIEQQMAALGIAMALARQEMMRLLATLIEQRRDPGSFPGADLMLSGFLDDEAGAAAIDLEDRYRDLLAQSRGRDAAAGRTLEGPHRSDLLVRHREKDMEAERCSTGEQKALLIGLVLAHAELVATMTGFAPILLLDEIAAHLDQGRRAALFDRIDVLGGQAFMTGTDTHMFESLGERAQFVTVDDGQLS
ncbi:DNA replication/repair protein RecF [Allorhizobium taibaishanense]|uniref:DNA replication and repair protein RecF n=1 Tax=Allorhizobium taibaishanense TaxID=887144 RepID=A0A1Q9A8H3_9HYPH|nr:DNA replication/repair protein RecF [Allorhizobium taibaishanense]MBB4009589.1 DNA replication and repair protein RecF [Allorhizobium taibaishanense]OLP50886.1 DNA replication/repair protein RecF [Allorhizobium taibaishanense]